MNNVCRRLRYLCESPSRDGEDYDAWLEQADLVKFLKKNAEEEKTVVYARVPDLLILSVLVPQADVDSPDVDDLLGSADAAREYRVRVGVLEYSDYMEILQKFSHVFGLHYYGGKEGMVPAGRPGRQSYSSKLFFSLEPH